MASPSRTCPASWRWGRPSTTRWYTPKKPWQDYVLEADKDGEAIVTPTALEHVDVPDGQTLVSIPVIRLSGRRVRANLSLDQDVATFIDGEAARRGMTRTAYVGWMARRIAQMGG